MILTVDHRTNEPLAATAPTDAQIIAVGSKPSIERKFQLGNGSILPEHRAQRVAPFRAKSARRYLQRRHLIDLKVAALAYSPSSPTAGRARGFMKSNACTTFRERTVR